MTNLEFQFEFYEIKIIFRSTHDSLMFIIISVYYSLICERYLFVYFYQNVYKIENILKFKKF